MSSRPLLIVSSLMLALLSSCATPITTSGDAAAALALAEDPGAEVLAEADRAFAADVTARGLDGWLHGFTEDIVKLQIDGEPLIGHAAVAAADGPLFENPDLRLSFGPDLAGWLEPGRRGYTRGQWAIHSASAPGDEPVAAGRYVTVWVLTAAGWRVELDVGVVDA